jgi:D-alanine-D-alanine ligase
MHRIAFLLAIAVAARIGFCDIQTGLLGYWTLDEADGAVAYDSSGNGNDLEILPIVEIQFDQLPADINPIYSYEAKWIWDTVERPLEIFTCPAKVSPRLRRKIQNVCQAAFSALRCRDWCRIDIRLDDAGEPNVLELNPLPGILPNPEANSCFPKAARTAGLAYGDLINRVLEIACQRVGLQP